MDTIHANDRSHNGEMLSEEHRRVLEEGSAIAPDVTSERGVRSISAGGELPGGFSRRQRGRAPGIGFPIHRPNGETDFCFRPDAPDPERPGHRYEMRCKALGAPGNVLDVHPSLRHRIADPSVPVIFGEGIKKADSLTSAARREGVEVLAVAVTGVWNWMAEKRPIEDMFDIPVEGRRVTICFDSDMLRNPDVQDAAKRLAEHLIGRGAQVFITYLRDQADGSKMGADDFFAGGGTFAELRMLTRRYDPADFVRIRLNRDERLRLALADLERRFWAEEWKGRGGCTDRDVTLKLIEAAPDRGKVVDGGIYVRKAWGELQVEAKIGARTLSKSLTRLEERGIILERIKAGKPDKSGGFVLSAKVYQDGTDHGTGQNATHPLQGLYAGTIPLRSPRLRWSRPKFTPKRGTVADTRKVRKGVKPERRAAIRRLGKIRGAIVDVLDALGGAATIQEAAEALNRKRPRDLIRRKRTPKGYDGPAIMLEDAGILTINGDVLSLADDWQLKLHKARVLGREATGRLEMTVEGETRTIITEGADEKARRDLARKRDAYHGRGQVEPDEAPTVEEMDRRREAAPTDRRDAIKAAIARLFAERPEYRERRVGQVTCALVNYLAPDFPRGPDGLPKDAEVEAILDGDAAA